MTTRFILFQGDPCQIALATMIFEQVSCLNFNQRPIKRYRHAQGIVVEYPNYPQFIKFYTVALERLKQEPEWNTHRPRIFTPVR